MDAFWEGFYKKSSKSTIEEWAEDSKKPPRDKDKEEKQRPADPVTASSSYTPDTYWRSWP